MIYHNSGLYNFSKVYGFEVRVLRRPLEDFKMLSMNTFIVGNFVGVWCGRGVFGIALMLENTFNL